MPKNTPVSTKVGASGDDNTSTLPCGVIYGHKAGTSVCVAGWFAQDQQVKLGIEAKNAGYHTLLLNGQPERIARLDLKPVSWNWRNKLQIDAVSPAIFAALEAIANGRDEIGDIAAIVGADQEPLSVEAHAELHDAAQWPGAIYVPDHVADAPDALLAPETEKAEVSEPEPEPPASEASKLAQADPLDQHALAIAAPEDVAPRHADGSIDIINDNEMWSGEHARPHVRDMHRDAVIAAADQALEAPVEIIIAETTPAASALVEGHDPAQLEPFRFKLDVPLEIGLVVLAPQEAENNGDEGWYEAVIKSIRPDGLELIWRDYPKELPFVRRHEQVALMIRPDLFPPPQPKLPKRDKASGRS